MKILKYVSEEKEKTDLDAQEVKKSRIEFHFIHCPLSILYNNE